MILNLSLFFVTDDGNSLIPKSIDEQLSTRLRVLHNIRRTTKFNALGDRSKYICIPQKVKVAGQHYIWEYHKGIPMHVATNIANKLCLVDKLLATVAVH